MGNQHTKGYVKSYVENYFKLNLKQATKEQLQKHYDKQGYIKATLTDEQDNTFTVKMKLYKHKQHIGERYFIECDKCGKRVTYLLYRFIERDGRRTIIYACRHCLDVNYMCQQVTSGDNDYHFYKMRQIGRKLDPDFTLENGIEFILCPFKPKHMKQVKYDKLRKQFVKHRNEAHKNWCNMLGVPVDEKSLEELNM